MNQKKKHSFLYLQCFQQRPFLKLSKKKLGIKNSHSNGHLTSFDAFAQLPNYLLTVVIGNWIEKKISRVQQRKYDTIVNIR